VSLVGVVGASLGSAVFFSVATALKHRGAGKISRVDRFRPAELLGFAAATLHHPLWLAGILADVGGLGLQVLALHIGALTVFSRSLSARCCSRSSSVTGSPGR
jgi:hypothetical protein